MTRTEFDASLNDTAPPAHFPPYLTALWWMKQDDWTRAHDFIDREPGANEARVHAYLHRVEGDEWNANYWYRRAGVANPGGDHAAELEHLLAKYLD